MLKQNPTQGVADSQSVSVISLATSRLDSLSGFGLCLFKLSKKLLVEIDELFQRRFDAVAQCKTRREAGFIFTKCCWFDVLRESPRITESKIGAGWLIVSGDERQQVLDQLAMDAERLKGVSGISACGYMDPLENKPTVSGELWFEERNTVEGLTSSIIKREDIQAWMQRITSDKGPPTGDA